jgi:hypothetical protein
MKRPLWAVALGFPAILSGTSATAQVLFEGASLKDCKEAGGERVIPAEKLRERAILKAGFSYSDQLAKIVAAGELGSVASSAVKCRDGAPCKVTYSLRPEGDPISEDDRKAYVELYRAMEQLSNLGAPGDTTVAPEGLLLVYDVTKLPAPDDRAVQFLNRGLNDFSVRCVGTSDPDQPKPDTPEKREPRGPSFIVGKSEADAGKTGLDEREFASFGLTVDRDAKKTTGDIDLYVSARIADLADTELEFSPYLALQYHSGDDVDDLAFGGEARWQPGSGNHVFLGRLAWETDHRFRSSALRAEAKWRLPWLFDLCEPLRPAKTGYVVCSATVVADFQHVYDAGTKSALLTVPEFTRIGLDADAAIAIPLPKALGRLRIGGTAALRQDISGRDADIWLLTGSIGILPSDTAHWKFSIDYTNGRDLTSLEKQDIIALSVGFRW